MSDPFLGDKRICKRGAFMNANLCPGFEAAGPASCYQCGTDDVYDQVMDDMQVRAETDAMRRTAPEIFADYEKVKEELRVAKAQLASYEGMLTRTEVQDLIEPLRYRNEPPSGVRVEKLSEREKGYLNGLLKAAGVYFIMVTSKGKDLTDQDKLEAITAAHVLDADIFKTWSREKKVQVIVTWNEILRQPNVEDCDV